MYEIVLVKSTPGVNFINVLWAAFTCADPECAKKTYNFTVFFTLLGSVGIKAVHRMLMILSPDVIVKKKRILVFVKKKWKFCFSLTSVNKSREKKNWESSQVFHLFFGIQKLVRNFEKIVTLFHLNFSLFSKIFPKESFELIRNSFELNKLSLFEDFPLSWLRTYSPFFRTN